MLQESVVKQNRLSAALWEGRRAGLGASQIFWFIFVYQAHLDDCTALVGMTAITALCVGLDANLLFDL